MIFSKHIKNPIMQVISFPHKIPFAQNKTFLFLVSSDSCRPSQVQGTLPVVATRSENNKMTHSEFRLWERNSENGLLYLCWFTQSLYANI